MFRRISYLTLEAKIELKKLYHEGAHGCNWVAENKIEELKSIVSVAEKLESMMLDYHRKYGGNQ